MTGNVNVSDDFKRDKLLNGEIFFNLREVQILIEHWRKYYKKRHVQRPE